MKEAALALKKAIQDYCRACVNAGVCSESACEFCPVQGTYDIVEKDLNPKVFFELFFDDKNDVAMCGVGTRVPSLEEANEFYKDDLEKMGYASFEAVNEITEEEASGSYDMDDEYPVFGKE